MERKSFKLKLNSEAFDEAGTFEGYASVFGNVDNGNDIVEHGAFAKSIRENPVVPILWQHNWDEPIGVTVEMSEDLKGLRVKGQLCLDTQRGKEAYALLKQGAIKGLSIGYQAIQKAWDGEIRKLKELKLGEYSLVTFPMNELATVTGVKMEKKSLEEVVMALEGAVTAVKALIEQEPGEPTPPPDAAAKAAQESEDAALREIVEGMKSIVRKEN